MRKIFATLFVFALTILAVSPALAAEAPATPDLDTFLNEIAAIDAPAALPMAGGNGKGNGCQLPPSQVDEECYCLSVYEPVCGCDGQTYSNSCLASCVIRRWTAGECNGGPATM